MFHPVGPHPPSVYWRRRLVLLGTIALVVVLIVLTVKTATSGSEPTAAGSAPSTPTTHSSSTAPPASSTHATTHRASTSTKPSSRHSSNSPAPQPCAPKDLAVQAVAAQSTYHVGDKPVLELQVTNTGAGPCVQDLADKQIELRVYNGESRVWGSHDCQIQPGTNPRTLAPHNPVRVAITWSGLSSQPRCAGTRQRVGPGTYTLYALLSGKTGKATQFTIS
jgi:hypothetical protein